jgi:hypothetical protein
LSAVLHQLNRFEEALSFLDDALTIDPRHALANSRRGLILRELGNLCEAEQALVTALRLNPRNAAAKNLLASVIADQGRVAEACGLLAQVLDDHPHNVDAHWTLATIELSMGEFATGWNHYEYRLKRNDVYVRPCDLPWWRPGLVHPGAVRVLAEQALGDEIMFASCYSDLLRDVDECHIECDPRLGRLFARSFPKALVLPTRDPLGSEVPAASGAGTQIAAGSVPCYYRRARESFPVHRGYLHAAPERVVHWRGRLAELGPGLNVGLSWVGGTGKTRRALRSLELDELEPVLRRPGVNFVSLQYTPCEDDIADFAGRTGVRVQHWPEAIADYDETASLISALDLVVSVTTALVHLTGALGKPVWVLVPAAPEWRYMRAGSGMPWYPSAQLFRQSTLNDWTSVVEAVRSELDRVVRRGRPDSPRCI